MCFGVFGCPGTSRGKSILGRCHKNNIMLGVARKKVVVSVYQVYHPNCGRARALAPDVFNLRHVIDIDTKHAYL
jgi:hypothetical protein